MADDMDDDTVLVDEVSQLISLTTFHPPFPPSFRMSFFPEMLLKQSRSIVLRRASLGKKGLALIAHAGTTCFDPKFN